MALEVEERERKLREERESREEEARRVRKRQKRLGQERGTDTAEKGGTPTKGHSGREVVLQHASGDVRRDERPADRHVQADVEYAVREHTTIRAREESRPPTDPHN
jgi:hypothetical protein